MARRVSRGVRVKPERARRSSLLPALLKALDARPDVTVLTRTWPVLFVHLRYVLEKTVVNADGFSPLHRETPLFYGQAFQLVKVGAGAVLHSIPEKACFDGETAILSADTLDFLPIHPEVATRLGLAPTVERQPALTGRAMER